MQNKIKPATSMNVPVATNERRLPRLKPHTPCPDVHPLPSRVPNPTNTPDTKIQTSGRGDTLDSVQAPPSRPNSKLTLNSPTKNQA